MGLIWVWWNTVEHVMHAKSIHLVIHEESIAIEKPYSCSFLFFHVYFYSSLFLLFSTRRLLDEWQNDKILNQMFPLDEGKRT